MNLTDDDLGLLESLGVPIAPGDSPMAILVLARHIAELQKRCAQLEQGKR